MRSLDISAERLNVVLNLLVRAGHALTASSDIGETLETIADLCVQAFADRCTIRVAIDALEADQFEVVAGTHPDQPVGDRSYIVEQLTAGRQTFGEIVCETASRGGFDDSIRQVLALLALQLAAVLSGRAATLREHRVADRFQRALLPERLPEVSGVNFCAAYRPASEEADVGGDWYDAFALDDGRIAISVGDVAGHGIDAAVIMGEVRQSIRMGAIGGSETPAAVLDYVNGMVRFRESIGMVTAVFAIYDPHTSTLTYAAAGHPPPILAYAGVGARHLPTGGLPLGCAAHVESVNWTFSVPQGARVVFYTDGLIENDRDVLAGEQRLLEAVEAIPRDERSGAAELVQENVFAGASNRDDAAVLVLTRLGPVPSYVFSALPLVSPIARAIVSNEVEPLGLSEDRRFGILVAVGEAIANAIEHGYRNEPGGLISLKIEILDDHLVLTIEDFGRWRPFVPREERGRGIELMHAFMDGVQIRSSRESTTIVLRARLDEDLAS
ncbi:MAG: SpoIIE family protein phosphatase [Candidatus Eremiobacteraeota bacterium]|nr:SpoIIE family protein phosphatase [Candidatus Eremiobacteraeota bacterium]MBV8721280.1 SpoIIE family protein phosphatase [Candidatus Eremiobacteraeota bacterium]